MDVLKTIAVLLVVLAAGASASSSSVHRTIESDDGVTIIDCVDMYQQPAFKHAPPGSRPEIQTKPPQRSMKAMAAELNLQAEQRPQAWRKHGGGCPAGTVPIRRASRSANLELARRASPFRRPATGISSFSNFSTLSAWQGKLEIAAAYATNGPYLGARAHVPHWRINVHPNELSMHYILIGNTLDKEYEPSPGAKPPANLTFQIAVGVVTWPARYNGDSRPRLFVYYTTDGAAEKNCFDTDCHGFHVVENAHFAVGDALRDETASHVGGQTSHVTVGIKRDSATENWWVTFFDQEVGYFPGTVFDGLFTEAVYVEMGGRVLDTRPGGKHTTTPMGSGQMACAGVRFAAAIKEYLGVAEDDTLFNDAADNIITTTPSCYGANALGFSSSRPGYSVVYGGPGGIFCDQP